MKEIYLKSVKKVLENIENLMEKLNVNIEVKSGKTIVSGQEIDEYFAVKVLEALDYPFDIDEALLLTREDYMFRVVKIKDHTSRRDYKVIKGRIIGTKGKALKVLEDLTNSIIVVKDNEVAFICRVSEAENTFQAIVSLIRGSKHGNVYSYLEKSHKRNKFDEG